MLSQQETIPFSSYSDLYNLIIPKNNLLRRINDLIDFSFVHKELVDKYSHDNGRTAESPIRMFKYLLLKTIYDISHAYKMVVRNVFFGVPCMITVISKYKSINSFVAGFKFADMQNHLLDSGLSVYVSSDYSYQCLL